MTHAEMLFEVPDQSWSTQTEAKNTDTGKNVVIKDKAKTPQNPRKVLLQSSLSFEIKKVSL